MSQPASSITASNGSNGGVLTATSENPASSPRPAARTQSPRPQSAEPFAENVFRKLLRCERKRAERSGKSVLLMLLEVRPILAASRSRNVCAAVTSALCSATRETDLIGWYENNAILGVIFTDVDRSIAAQLQKVMRLEITAALEPSLGSREARQLNFSFYLFPEEWPDAGGPPREERIDLDLSQRSVVAKLSRLGKRAIDIALSFFAIAVLSPLFLLISAAVKMTSKGPVLFRQQRVGQQGRRFTFLKFRSMECGSDPLIHQEYVKRFITGDLSQGKGTTYKITEDPRLTRIGAFLRKCSLDELPQLINVLKGEMSLVGPRPAIPYEIDFYRAWHRARFLDVKPGITGLWQVKGRSKTTFDDMVRLDLRYAKHWSFWLDIKILLATPKAVLSREGAY